MNEPIDTICEERRGRMRMKIVRKSGQYGPQYSVIVYRPYKHDEDENGRPIWKETHWLDEQVVLSARRLHEIADDVIAKTRRRDALKQPAQVA